MKMRMAKAKRYFVRFTGLVVLGLLMTMLLLHRLYLQIQKEELFDYSAKTSSHLSVIKSITRINPNINTSTPPCNMEELKVTVKNVFFFRLHKVGSTTLWSILHRYGLRNGLRLPVLASPTRTSKDIMTDLVPPFNRTVSKRFNIFGDHAYYNRDVIDDILEKPYVKVILYRDPVHVFVSMVKAYGNKSSITQDDLFNYLDGSDTSLDKYKDFASKQLNLPMTNTSKTHNFSAHVQKLLGNFTVVMLGDEYILSLMLLRRTLQWPMEHFIHFALRQSYRVEDLQNEAQEDMRDMVCRWNPHDCIFYEVLKSFFWAQVKRQDAGIFGEADTFDSINKRVQIFCLKYKKADLGLEELVIEATIHSKQFTFSRSDCKLLQMMPEAIRKMYYPRKVWQMVLNRQY